MFSIAPSRDGPIDKQSFAGSRLSAFSHMPRNAVTSERESRKSGMVSLGKRQWRNTSCTSILSRSRSNKCPVYKNQEHAHHAYHGKISTTPVLEGIMSLLSGNALVTGAGQHTGPISRSMRLKLVLQALELEGSYRLPMHGQVLEASRSPT